jgi:hypothetical protein
MSKSKSLHLLKVKFLPWTERKPSRIMIISDLYKQNVIIPYETDNGNDTCEIAEHWLQSKGFEIIGHVDSKDCYYIVSSSFLKLDHYKKIITKPAE